MADPTAQSPTLLWDVARDLLAAAEDGLVSAGLAPPPRVHVVAGVNPAWDSCCPGQMTARLARTFFTTAFPAEVAVAQLARCSSATLAGEYLVEIVACAPSSSDQGDPPTAEALDVHARETLLWSYAALRGLLCWASERGAADPFEDLSAVVRALEPIGEQGGCIGYLIRVVVALEETCPCAPLGPLTP